MKTKKSSIELRERRLAVLVTVIPFLGTIAAIILATQIGFGWLELVLFLPMYILGEIGAEVGHHRYFSHKAFKPHPKLKVILAILASTTGKGSVFEFAAVHRRHHQYADRPGDPHSPHEFGRSFKNILKGFWHSYYGWILHYPMNPAEHARVIDLLMDPVLVRIANKKMYYVWLVLGAILPAVLGYMVTGNTFGMVIGFLWGGMVRVFLEQHSAFAINTICHISGSRPFATKDQSRNNALLAYLTLGVGWHNNHHAFPYTAYNQFKWWQLDPCGWLIFIFEKFGLATEVRYPSKLQRNERASLAT